MTRVATVLCLLILLSSSAFAQGLACIRHGDDYVTGEVLRISKSSTERYFRAELTVIPGKVTGDGVVSLQKFLIAKDLDCSFSDEIAGVFSCMHFGDKPEDNTLIEGVFHKSVRAVDVLVRGYSPEYSAEVGPKTHQKQPMINLIFKPLECASLPDAT